MTEAQRRYSNNPNYDRVTPDLRRWYDQYDWLARARAWDRYLQRREAEALASGREDAARKRGTTLADLESKQLEAAFEIADALPTMRVHRPLAG